MNDQSQIEAKIIHFTPPRRFQVAHQLPKDLPAVPTPVCPPLKGEEYKVITTNPSKIWAIRILNGPWLLVTLFLKRCTRIDKNLLVVYVALVLLLLQVFMVISRAEAGPQNRRIFNSEHNLSPLIAAGGPSTFWLDPKSTKKIKGFPKVPWARGSARLLSARAEGCFHLVPGEGECRGLQPKALSAHRPASDSKPYGHCRKARRIYESGCRTVTSVSVPENVYERANMIARGGQHQPLMTSPFNLIADRQHTRSAQTFDNHIRCNARGTASRSSCRKTSISTLHVVRYITEKPALASADVYQFASAQNIDSDGRSRGVLVLFRCRKRTRPLPAAMSGLEQKSMLLTVPYRASSVSIPLSGPGVPQMITSFGS